MCLLNQHERSIKSETIYQNHHVHQNYIQSVGGKVG